MQGANVTWYGDLKTKPIKQKSGLFSSTVVGHYYYLGIQMAVCHGPIDAFLELRCDGKKPKYTTKATDYGVQITVNDPEFFGEKKREGGLRGTIDFYFGTAAQTPNDYLVAKIGKNLPGYRNVCYAVFRQFYAGNSNYIKPFSFIVRRCPNNLNLASGANNISGDANPAEMIYEYVTTPDWGMGLPSASLDVESFRLVGNALAAEGSGLSIMMDSPTSGKDEGDVICRHIDGLVYQDPATAAISMALVRNDYDSATVPCLGKGCVKAIELNRKSWSETKNCIKVTYTDRAADYGDRVAQQQDLGNIQARGGQVSSEAIDLKGFSNADAANRAAARMLRTLSFPIATLHVTCNRIAWDLRPGSVVRLQWEPLGIDGIYRVGGINYGGLVDGYIELDCTEDIFSVTGDAYVAPPASDWTDPADDVTLGVRPVEVTGLTASAVSYAGGNSYTASWTWTSATSTQPAPDRVFLLYGPATANPADYAIADAKGTQQPTATLTWTGGPADASSLRLIAVAQSAEGCPAEPDPHWTGSPTLTTTLAADCEESATSLTVASAAALGTITAGTVLQLYSADGEEFVSVASVAGGTIALETYDGERVSLYDTAAQFHLTGVAVSVAVLESANTTFTAGTVANSGAPSAPSEIYGTASGDSATIGWTAPATNALGLVRYIVTVGPDYSETGGVYSIPAGQTYDVPPAQTETTVLYPTGGQVAVGVQAENAHGVGAMGILWQEY